MAGLPTRRRGSTRPSPCDPGSACLPRLRGARAQQAGRAGQEAPVSHAAVYSEVSFWFVAGLTLLLLLMIVGVVVRTPPGTVGSPQPPQLNPPAPPPPPPPLLAGWAQAVGLADTAVTSAGAGYRPRHARALEPELMVAGGPPWGPAPKPPDLAGRGAAPWLAAPGQMPGKARAYRELPPGLGPSRRAGNMSCAADMTGRGLRPLRSAPIAAADIPSGGQAGARRQAPRHGAHRAGISTGGRAGAHRQAPGHGAHRPSLSSGQVRRSAGRTGRHRAGVH
jgi:hypothetical protein